MTIISDRSIDETRDRAEEATRRLTAAVEGALEGFNKAFDEYHVDEQARDALHEAGEFVRAGGTEARAVGQSPEMRRAGETLSNATRRAGAATTSAGHTVADTTRDAKDRVVGAAGSARESVQERAHDVRERATHMKDTATERMHDARDNVKARAEHAREEYDVRKEHVKEGGRRAKAAPRNVTHELKGAFGAWKRGFTQSLAMMGGMALLAITAFIVLTISFVTYANAFLGDPLGTLAIGIAYVILAGIAYAAARGARTRATKERRAHMERTKEEVRSVGRPLRRAVTRGRTGT